MDFAELEKDTASRDEWLLMCRKQIFYQIQFFSFSDFPQTTFFPFAAFFVFEKDNMDDECKKLLHKITPPRYMRIKIITCLYR
ncbi:unnamed protein product [Malus baccata var. baccata]